jgi:hypothetical protein
MRDERFWSLKGLTVGAIMAGLVTTALITGANYLAGGASGKGSDFPTSPSSSPPTIGPSPSATASRLIPSSDPTKDPVPPSPGGTDGTRKSPSGPVVAGPAAQPPPVPAPPSPPNSPALVSIGRFNFPSRIAGYVFDKSAGSPESYGTPAFYKGPGYPSEYMYVTVGFDDAARRFASWDVTHQDGNISCSRNAEDIPNSTAHYVQCWAQGGDWYIDIQEPAPDGREEHTANLVREAVNLGLGPNPSADPNFSPPPNCFPLC